MPIAEISGATAERAATAAGRRSGSIAQLTTRIVNTIATMSTMKQRRARSNRRRASRQDQERDQGDERRHHEHVAVGEVNHSR